MFQVQKIKCKFIYQGKNNMSKEKNKESKEKKPLAKRIIKIILLLVIGFIVVCALVYEYKGERVTIKDTIVCDYEGYSWSLEGGNSRDWTCDMKNDEEYGQYYVDKENYPGLYIDVPEVPDYYMGDKEYTVEDTRPVIKYDDESTGTRYEETDKIDAVDIKIIEWKPSEPLKNNIKQVYMKQ